MQLHRASNFSLQQLTDAYNQTRVDYIVPMPMNVARLQEYIDTYDIDLEASWVAMDGKIIFGYRSDAPPFSFAVQGDVAGFTGFTAESATSQDTTERFTIRLGPKNDSFGPETGTDDSPTATIAITGISSAAAGVAGWFAIQTFENIGMNLETNTL